MGGECCNCLCWRCDGGTQDGRMAPWLLELFYYLLFYLRSSSICRAAPDVCRSTPQARFLVQIYPQQRVVNPFLPALTMSSPIPEDYAIEETLRAIVARLHRSGDHSDLTVKRVRKAAELELELPDDYLKENQAWKTKSKDIIADEHVGCSITKISRI